MVIKDGRFGPYVTDGETNASLRKGDDVATITVTRAAELLAERRASAPAPRAKRATTVKSAPVAKKPAGSAAKKAPAKKPATARKKTEP
jgi:DNA topoisomerase-1